MRSVFFPAVFAKICSSFLGKVGKLHDSGILIIYVFLCLCVPVGSHTEEDH